MHGMTDEVGHDSPWTMMFVNEIVSCSRSRKPDGREPTLTNQQYNIKNRINFSIKQIKM